jgi:hypothetical protein
MKRVSQKIPESGVLRACLDLLAAEKIWHERRNTVPVLVDNGRGGKRPIKVGEKGTPDIMASIPQQYCGSAKELDLRFQIVLWIECKSDSGQQSPKQKEFQQRAEAAGHFYLLVRDVDTLRDWLKEHGV